MALRKQLQAQDTALITRPSQSDDICTFLEKHSRSYAAGDELPHGSCVVAWQHDNLHNPAFWRQDAVENFILGKEIFRDIRRAPILPPCLHPHPPRPSPPQLSEKATKTSDEQLPGIKSSGHSITPEHGATVFQDPLQAGSYRHGKCWRALCN